MRIPYHGHSHSQSVVILFRSCRLSFYVSLQRPTACSIWVVWSQLQMCLLHLKHSRVFLSHHSYVNTRQHLYPIYAFLSTDTYAFAGRKVCIGRGCSFRESRQRVNSFSWGRFDFERRDQFPKMLFLSQPYDWVWRRGCSFMYRRPVHIYSQRSRVGCPNPNGYAHYSKQVSFKLIIKAWQFNVQTFWNDNQGWSGTFTFDIGAPRFAFDWRRLRVMAYDDDPTFLFCLAILRNQILNMTINRKWFAHEFPANDVLT